MSLSPNRGNISTYFDFFFLRGHLDLKVISRFKNVKLPSDDDFKSSTKTKMACCYFGKLFCTVVQRWVQDRIQLADCKLTGLQLNAFLLYLLFIIQGAMPQLHCIAKELHFFFFIFVKNVSCKNSRILMV